MLRSRPPKGSPEEYEAAAKIAGVLAALGGGTVTLAGLIAAVAASKTLIGVVVVFLGLLVVLVGWIRWSRVVDLSTPPKVPSLYDPERRHLRPGLIFLRHFVDEISKPFVRDDRIHIEYVPTQVVTEWLRTRFDPGPGEPVVGVLYGSARSPGGVNVSLFIDNDGACDPDDERDSALLALDEHERLTSSAPLGWWCA